MFQVRPLLLARPLVGVFSILNRYFIYPGGNRYIVSGRRGKSIPFITEVQFTAG